MNNLGPYLLLLFFLGIVISLFITKRKTIAKNGGVAVGGNNYGKIKITNNGPDPKGSSLLTVWNVFVSVAGLIGVIFTIWPLDK